ncbi:hypothetical protein AALA24_12210 [Anaerovoracaceae bacterium 42-11]
MTGKKHILAILILAGICLLCACEQTTKENADIASEIHAGIADPAAAEKARAILQEELDQEVKAGRLLEYDGFWTAPLMAEKDEAIQVIAGYKAIFGSGKGASGFIATVKCILTMKQEADGTFSEMRDKRQYEEMGSDTSDNLSWIIDHPYVARISKEEVYGKGRDEIARMMFCQWMDTLKDWDTSTRTFLVTQYDSPEVRLIASVDTKKWETSPELEGPRPKHPDSLGGWIYNCQCRYQFLGYSSNVSLGTCLSGNAVGIAPFWVEDIAPGLNTKHFILTEWQDSYTLETRKHCLETIGKVQ